MNSRIAAAAVAAALAVAAARGASAAAPEPAEAARAPDAGVAALSPSPADRCAALAQRLERRKAWLAARRQEQFERGGPPDPALGIANAVGVWCEEHPGDEECALGGVAIEVRAEELAYDPTKTPEDYDAHVVMLKRELSECRERARRGGR